MNTREKPNDNNRLVGIVLSVLVAVIIGTVVYQVWPGSPGMSATSYYTTDHGKTYFRDSLLKFPPFEHNGATAVRALVFRSDAGEFVGMLQRYKPETRKLLDAAMADVAAGKKTQGDVEQLIGSDRVRDGTEAALPGPDPKWKPAHSLSPSDVKAPDKTPAIFVTP